MKYLHEQDDILIMTNELLRAEEPVTVEALTIQMGVCFPREAQQLETRHCIRGKWAEAIIKGRELPGEPGGFIF